MMRRGLLSLIVALLFVSCHPIARALASGVPVMTSDQTAKTTVYYDSYQGNLYPNWNGSAMASITITADEISMGLDAGTPHIASGNLYDVFGTAAAALCAGPAWLGTRGTGAGTSELQLKLGVWTNKNALTNCWGGAAGATNLGSIPANQATYLGTLYATANGQTGMQFTPAAASGGSNAILGLYNGYNRIGVDSYSADSTGSWSYSTSTWRSANNNNGNRISFVDGLGQSPIRARYDQMIQANAVQCGIGVNLYATSGGPPGVIAAPVFNSNVSVSQPTVVNFPPKLGFHFVQAMEFATGSCTFYGSATQGLILEGMGM
jgi:hypothetical protein